MNDPSMAGKILPDWYVYCGLCDTWRDVMESDTNIMRMVIYLIEERWGYSQKHGWLCPDCAVKEGAVVTIEVGASGC